MRVIVDTNILLGALINPHGLPAELVDCWRTGRFALVTSREQLLELGEVARRPTLRKYVDVARAGRFISDLCELAEVLHRPPAAERNRDPDDDFLLATAASVAADYLVTGDESDLLVLKSHGATRIVTARHWLQIELAA